jgi:aryl-alcohol dehydrogenase-like predicted oxidoreductase
VGELIAADRERYVVSTKYSIATNYDDPNAFGNGRKNLMTALEKSLKRMNTEYVDVYWVHFWDHTTPVDEVMRALDDVVRSGKALYVGISDAPAWVVSQANTLADLRGWSRFIGLQIEYSLIERTSERELLPMARALDIGVLAWRVLGEGALSGKYAESESGVDSMRSAGMLHRLSEKNRRIASEVDAIAKELNRKSTQVAIRWVMQQKGSIIPIVGVRTAEQMEDNLRCLDFELSPDHMARLTKVSAIELGFPHDFINHPAAREMVFGKTNVINHRAR